MSDTQLSIAPLDTTLRAPSAQEHMAQRLLRLQNLGLALTAVSTVEQAADVVITQGFAAFNTTLGAVYLRDAHSADVVLLRAVGSGGEPATSAARFVLEGSALLADVMQSRQPLFLETGEEHRARYAPPAPLVAEEPFGALVVLPLLVEDRVLGGLELCWHQDQFFDSDARAFMQIVAQMCAQAVESARLYEAEQRARRMAEQASERTARLQTVTARLSQALSVAEVGEVILGEGAAALGAHRGVLALLNATGDELEVARTTGYSPAVTHAWQHFDLNAPIPLADVVRQREAVWLHDLAERDHRYPQLARIQTTSQAYAVLPLLVDARIVGGISFGFEQARGFDKAERAFITALAQQCAQTLERARLHDAAAAGLAEIELLNARLQRAMAETHHRVKNNLQVISALVELQTDPDSSLVPSDALQRIGGHARALATLHDLLTDQAKNSLDHTTVSTRALLGKMVPLLQATMGEHPLQADIDDMRLPVRIGASLCLLINELVSNALKHGGKNVTLALRAAPDRRHNHAAETTAPIVIASGSLPEGVQTDRRQNRTEEPVTHIAYLTVEDDGPGFPPDFDPRRMAHTGLDLVSNLSRLDLSGGVTYANRPQGGASVTITFPLPE